jgi:adenylate kinase
MLDGFPRTVPQAEALDGMLQNLSSMIDHVVSIEVGKEELVKRLTGRRTCRECGAGYHVMFDPPKKEDVCDKCGGELYQRDDDNVETVTSRLEVYEAQTLPLIDYYKTQGKVRPIDGVGEIKDIFGRITQVLS